ncbi:MAG: hypothetical protein MUP40_05985 [Actinobacteria bacterium]|nr:hypothetical protein [Actinomycetota bacterium]
MTHAILSDKELAILEKIIQRYGPIASFEDIKKLLATDYSSDEIKKQVSHLVKRGWLVRMKRGAFAVASLESHSFASISPLLVSQVLVPDSYVSFEFALGHHGLFDQLPAKLTAITPVKPRRFAFQAIDYEYRKIKPVLYFGYEEVPIDSLSANVAELEKVFLDYLYFRIDTYSVDIVLEKLAEGKDDIDYGRLSSYAERFPLAVQRRLGFLMDLAGVSTEDLHQTVKKRPGYSKLTRTSGKFNAKWRIYYEDRFTE